MHTGRHIVIGLGVAALLLGLKMLIEATDYGREFDTHAYRLLQSALPSLYGRPLPIVVVDISRMPGGKDQATPRDDLLKLLAAVAAKDPVAIAVDIDFSPNGSGWMTPRDPDFFDGCLALRQRRGRPIFLGVFRTRKDGPATWLGLAKYQSLAAAGIANGDDTRRIPRWVQTDDPDRPLPTLSEALAHAYRANPWQPPWWLSWSLERWDSGPPTAEEFRNGHGTLDVLVNYSKLDQLKSEHLSFIRPETTDEVGSLLRGRLVLLGDVDSPMDTFNVPGERLTVPGVYLMAAAAYTLAVEPLFEFREASRITLDVLLSLIIVVGAISIAKGAKSPATSRKRRQRFVLATIIVVFGAGIALVRLVHVMWSDFLLVLFAILLHPKLEDWLFARLRVRGKSRGEAHA